MRFSICSHGSRIMPSVNRDQLLPHWHKMVKQGGFWGRMAEAAILADDTNRETLLTAFPKLIEGQALRRPRLTLLSFTSEMPRKLAK